MSFSVLYSSNIVCITLGSTPYLVRNLAEASLAFIFAVLKPLRKRETVNDGFNVQARVEGDVLK